MSKITSTTWVIKPHTEAKHAILKKYLDAWLPIMARWNSRILYVDGFAGPGEYKGGQDGSPVIAINSILEHRVKIKSEVLMLFIEARRKRYEFLKQKIATLKISQNVKCECIYGKFDKTLTELFDYIDEQKLILAPAFIFIDPFGFTGIPFDLIKRIMESEKSEVLITFMYEEINRFIKKTNLRRRLTETFGTDEWKKTISVQDPKQKCGLLHGIYKKQLEHEAGIKFVCSFKMVNKANKADYFLFFGTNNITGLKKMKETMWKVDESGLFQFSDMTHNSRQPMLFEIGPDYSQLEEVILKKFRGRSITIQELESFILTQTSFRETHYKRQILAPMEKLQPSKIVRKCRSCNDDCKIRIGCFPKAHCIIEFL